MVGILQGKARGGEEESILMHDLKPFRILISLLDKPELGISLKKNCMALFQFLLYILKLMPRVIHLNVFKMLGPAILEDVLIEVFRTLHTQCRAELDLQNQNPFSKDQTQLSRSGLHCIHRLWWINLYTVNFENFNVTFVCSVFLLANLEKTKRRRSSLKQPTFYLTPLSPITCGITLHAGLRNAAGADKIVFIFKLLFLFLNRS